MFPRCDVCQVYLDFRRALYCLRHSHQLVYRFADFRGQEQERPVFWLCPEHDYSVRREHRPQAAPARRGLPRAGRAAAGLAVLAAGSWLGLHIHSTYYSLPSVPAARTESPVLPAPPREENLDDARKRIRALEQERDDLERRVEEAKEEKTHPSPSPSSPDAVLEDFPPASVETLPIPLPTPAPGPARAGRETPAAQGAHPTGGKKEPKKERNPAARSPEARLEAPSKAEPAEPKGGAGEPPPIRGREKPEPRSRLLPTERLNDGSFR
jgi:hypothetical protein